MNQTRAFGIIRVAFLALVATVASSGLLCAADHTGSFTLPFETRWGTMTLPAGEYSFKVNIDVSPYTVSVSGKDGTTFAFPASVSEDPASGQSELIVLRRGKHGVIRAMRLPQEHLIFRYALPKGEREWLLAEGPEMIQRIPIVLNRKSSV